MTITVKQVSKDFRGRPRALNDVNAQFNAGMIGLLGANGAGKTTLMRILCGILEPSSGSVVVDGGDLADPTVRRRHKQVLGYLPQHIEPYPHLNPREFLDYMGLLKGITDRSARRDQADELLVRVGLEDVATRRMGGFSGGMRRRVGIAQALLGDPAVVIVDEPTAGLDPQERMRFRALLSTLGTQRTVILSTRILDDVAQTCPKVCVMRAGSIVHSGPTAGLIDQARGRTYELTTTAPPPGHLKIVNAVAAPNGTTYRIVGDRPPAGAVPVDPRLEDGYTALMDAAEMLR